jgi:hypothetical protein
MSNSSDGDAPVWGHWIGEAFVPLPKTPLRLAGYGRPPFEVVRPDRSTILVVIRYGEAKHVDAVMQRIASERTRQIIEKQYTQDHDDLHVGGELALGAAAYAALAAWTRPGDDAGRSPHVAALWGRVPGMQSAVAELWPFDAGEFRPSDRARMLVKAAAMIVAELERIDRLDRRPAPPSLPDATGTSGATASSSATAADPAPAAP